MKYYKKISVAMALLFSIVGLIFLVVPNGVLSFFNSLSIEIGMKESPINGMGFYLILASG